MAAPFSFNSRIRSVRLPVPGNIPNTALTLSGWGSTGGILPPNVLQKAILPAIPIDVCRTAWHNLGLDGYLVEETNFCTGPLTGGLSACSGDSGGPLVYGSAPHEILEGVVSWGVTPCKYQYMTHIKR